MNINASSMMAHQTMMNVTANNVANVNSKDYSAKDATIDNNLEVNTRDTKQATNLTKEMTDMISTQGGFDSQVPAIKTANEMMGTLLNLKA